MNITIEQLRERGYDANGNKIRSATHPNASELDLQLPDRESELHNKIIKECNRRGWPYHHSSMAHRTHSTLGWPDFTIITNDNRKVLLVECKTSKGKLSIEQQAIGCAMKRIGQDVFIVRSFDDFWRVAECLPGVETAF